MAGRAAAGFQVTPLARTAIEAKLKELEKTKARETLLDKGQPVETKVGTQRWLALRIGVSEPTISAILSPEADERTSEHLVTILDLLRIPRWVTMSPDQHIERRRAVMEELDRQLQELGEEGADEWLRSVIATGIGLRSTGSPKA